jgi:type 1 glutamine amidotransferase
MMRIVPLKIMLCVILLGGVGLVVAGCLPARASLNATSPRPAAANVPMTEAPAAEAQPAEEAFSVLVFSKTAGFRHASIPAGITAIQELGAQYNFQVDATEDASWFTDETLAGYRVVIFLSTTGDVLNETQQAAFERFIQQGGGFVGIHAASDTEYQWPWYGELVGAYFASHPTIQPARLLVIQTDHLSTYTLPAEWNRTDEWYNFGSPPGPEVDILLNLDETSYQGGTMGENHPLSWYHEYDGGRSWYTGMGHTIESFSEPLFRQHIAGGILWAADAAELSHVMIPLVVR